MTQETAVEKTAEQVAQELVESDSALESGFSQARGTSPVEKKPEAKAEEPKVEAPKTEVSKEQEVAAPADPVKAQLDSITQKLGDFDKLEQRFKSFEGRIHKVTGLVEQLTQAGKAAVVAAPAAEKQALADKVDAQLKQIGTDLPDVAELVKAAREELRAEFKAPADVVTKADLEKAVSERVAEVQAQTKAEVAQARVLAAIDLKHDGWEETINSKEFEVWYGAQPKDVQQLSASPKAQDAIRMLDLFRSDEDKAKQKQEQEKANAERLARATTPKGVPGSALPTQTEDEALEAGFNSVRGR